MKKKRAIRIVALVLSVLLGGCAQPSTPNKQIVTNREGDSESWPDFAPEAPTIHDPVVLPDEAKPTSDRHQPLPVPDEVSGVWISYLELQDLLYKKSEDEFRANIAQAFDNIVDFGLNTVIIQVRPFGDALYESEYFPWSHLITGTEGEAPAFDPLAMVIEEARARNLRVEAWLNPYRIRSADSNVELSDDNPAKKWLESQDRSVVQYNGAISYNPASERARELILSGVREIVQRYPIDAIHIDDYFYPTTDEAFDRPEYEQYRKQGGMLSQDDWRRENVTKLIRGMYQTIKEVNPMVLFGISPQSSMENNFGKQYLDIYTIAGENGYCDYIMPQIYFGFENETQPFSETLAEWDKLVSAPDVKLYTGLSAYKVGAEDQWAGEGKNEWLQNDDLLARMLEECRNAENYGGFGLYRYDSVFCPEEEVQEQTERELQNFQEIL